MQSKLILVALLGLFASAQAKRFDGDKVFQLVPKNSQQVQVLRQFLDESGEDYDFWKPPSVPGESVDLRVTKNFVKLFQGLMNVTGIQNRVVIDDVQQMIDQVEAQNAAQPQTRGDVENRIVNTFPKLEDIKSWMDTMCATYPEKTTCGDIGGKSYEGRNINYITIGTKFNDGRVKKTIFIEGTIHAREWLSTATIIYIADKMMTEYGKDPTFTRMVDKYNFIIVPVVNVDGYQYTISTDRMWRKTRSVTKTAFQTCYGVDPNRNWDHNWATVGSSASPCSDTYHGPKVFSEVETQALSKFIKANSQDMLAYFSFHAYYQLWMLPFGSGGRPSDYDELMRVGNIGMKALMAVNKKTWNIGTIQEIIYPAAGGSPDWVKESCGVKYVYCLELRPTQSTLNGFVVATSEIEPSAKEVWAGFVAAIDAMQQ